MSAAWQAEVLRLNELRLKEIFAGSVPSAVAADPAVVLNGHDSLDIFAREGEKIGQHVLRQMFRKIVTQVPRNH